MESCIYEGRVYHRRERPVPHAFTFPLYMIYLDLDELPEVFRGRWLWSVRRRALARFRREDYLGPPDVPLDRAVRDLVEARLGRRPEGPIRLLTQLRVLGYVFNPLSLYYCFDRAGQGLEAVVAEVTNIPWQQRHCYVLAPDPRSGPGPMRAERRKEFHVSPFLEMELDYRFTLHRPDRSLAVRIVSHDPNGTRRFDAWLAMRRVEIDGRSLARVLVRYPWMTAQVVAAIYWQALRLRRKGAPVHPHPGERAEEKGRIRHAHRDEALGHRALRLEG